MTAPISMRFTATGPLAGRITVPGDNADLRTAPSMLSSLAVGESRIEGLLEGEDVLATAAAMRAMGASIERDARTGLGLDDPWRRRRRPLLQPEQALDM